MQSMVTHPSYFALDLVAVDAGGSNGDNAQIRQHVEACARCSAYVGELRAEQQACAAAPIPSWVPRRVPRRWPARLTYVGGALAAAAALLFVFLGDANRGTESEQYTTARGASAAAVYVRRGGRVFLWNGSDAVLPGDQLRVKVAPDGLSHAAVFSAHRDSTGAEVLELLHAEAVAPHGETLFERAWEVDGTAGSETLVIAMGQSPLDATGVSRALRAPATAPGLWVRRLTLRKAAAPAGKTN